MNPFKIAPPFPPIPPDSADGHSSWVHRALILTGQLGRVPALLLLPLWLLLLALAAWPWGARWPVAAAITAAFWLADWATLAALPALGRSWGPVSPSLLGLLAVRVLLSLGGALVGEAWLLLTANAGLSAVMIYATWSEPFQVKLTRQSLQIPQTRSDSARPKRVRPLRLLHISDLHLEHVSPRERRLLELVAETAPDVILLTGDYLNLSSVYDKRAQEEVRGLLAQLTAPLGVYAVTGSPVVDVAGIVPAIFAGLDIRWLDDEAVALPPGPPVWLLGVRTTYDEARDEAALRQVAGTVPAGSSKVLLYHTPDLMPVAASLGESASPDLYLCGHTHGGQLRLPLYGALATSSRWGKRYEQGRYREQDTTLYVSRGLGMEGLGAPRARFLAPPEVVLWTLHLS